MQTLGQAVKGLDKVLRAMADGSLDDQLGSRLCNGLGIMRAFLETATLERLSRRLDEIEGAPDRGPSWRDGAQGRALQ